MSLYTDIERSKIAVSGNFKEGIRAEFNFPANLDLFKGHFSDNPILPGIAQIELVKITLETVLGRKLFIRKVKKTKFSRPIKPETHVLVDIDILAPKDGEKGLIPAKATVLTGNVTVGKINLLLAEQTT
ncbi:MAG: hypothetical protein RQ739_16775 [Desulfotignum sp.]|nr:hypothetical protein [Desulfotignum sp.]